MAYRRPDETGLFSSRWRIANKGALLECGIPAEIAASDRRWRYVLLHGNDPASGWSSAWLSAPQANQLLALLKPHVPSPAGIWLIEDLNRARYSAGGTECRTASNPSGVSRRSVNP